MQDALRIKAVNRPLTYALKDLSLELKVFVELDAQGKVRFRTSGPNEAGASIVHLGFTTITKPMIEENTISLATSRSPSLEEQQRLERVGVRNVAQLQRLGSSTGVQTIARLSEVPVDRLKAALAMGRPQIKAVMPEPARPPQRPLVSPPINPRSSATSSPPRVYPNIAPSAAPVSPGSPDPGLVPPAERPPVLKISPDTRRLHLSGINLIGEEGPPTVRLNAQPLGITEAEDDRLVVEMPERLESGALEVVMPDGHVIAYDLSVGHDGEKITSRSQSPNESYSHDSWAPSGRRD